MNQLMQRRGQARIDTLWRRLLLSCLLAALFTLASGLPTLQARSMQATLPAPPAPLAPQTFRYHAPAAGEVYLVWGINGWQVAPAALQPPGTIIEFGVMSTPMQREGDTFVAQLALPAGTALSYGFQTRKSRAGQAISWLWDGDYQAAINGEAIIEKQATVTVQATNSPAPPTGTPVVQEVRYHAPEAGEVYLVWGINGWQAAPAAALPPGTVSEFGVRNTPMALEGETFVAQLRLPAGAVLDYGFQSRKKRSGAPITWVWDGDYQQTLQQDGVIAQSATVTLAQAKEQIVDFTLGPPLCITISLLLAVALWLRRRLPWATVQRLSPYRVMVAGGGALWLLLWLLRTYIIGFHWIAFTVSAPFLPAALAAGYGDLRYVSILTGGGLALLWLLRRRHRAQWGVTWLYYGLALFSVVIGFANIAVIRLHEQPVTYQWLYYADFLASRDAQEVLKTNLSPSILLNAVTLSLGLVVLARLLCVGQQLLPVYQAPRLLLGTLLVPFCLYTVLAPTYAQPLQATPNKVANPIVHFLGSMVAAWRHPPLVTLPLAPADFADFQPPVDPPAPLTPYPNSGAIKNVILFVMESVGAEYLTAYGSPYPVTPTIDRYRPQTLLFDKIYAGAPASNKSLFSLLSGTYDLLSYSSLTQVAPDLPVPTLSSELAQRGYRTAFFSAGDTTFQRGDEFLAHSNFARIQDYDDLDCERAKVDLAWEHADGVDEACLVDAFGAWQQEQPTAPFFTMMWTVGTHYPYVVMGDEVDYGVNDAAFNRYLNALHHTDEALGSLLQLLEARALLTSTLVVMVGDHGEAFGQHDQIGHAQKIYDENVHVPLLLLNPGLFHGERNGAIGGHIDIAPTILHLLNQPAPAIWQGQSLLRQERRPRAYFFAPWSDLWFGYRDGNQRFLFNATTDQYELYDIVADPEETQNLIGQRPDLIPVIQRRLAAWVQYHGAHMEKLLEQGR